MPLGWEFVFQEFRHSIYGREFPQKISKMQEFPEERTVFGLYKIGAAIS